jgi:MFS family permease
MIRNLPRTVLVLSLVSFLTDLSGEMIYPLLPAFLAVVLGAGALELGVIEGVAESTAALIKVFSGLWADRIKRRKPFVVAGYGIAGLIRPLVGFATAWSGVLLVRFIDRVGKGIRTAPRDALIADVTDPSIRGAAYGFHRAMDHAGAVVGPLVAAGLLALSFSMRHVFLFAAIPAVVVMVVLAWGIKEKPVEHTANPGSITFSGLWKSTGPDFKLFLGSLLVFTLGNSTDAFLLLRMTEAGVTPAWVAILWAAHHVVKMFSTYIGGQLSDRFGRRGLIVMGWIVYALIYTAFALVDSPSMLVVIFLAYGVYFGLTEPCEKAWVADLVPAQYRGSAFGFYNCMIGIGALPASLIFGLLWKEFGVATAFLTGGTLAIIAAILLLFVRVIPKTEQCASREA